MFTTHAVKLNSRQARKETEMAEPQNSTGKSNRGFASMDRTKQREIARKGGESVPNEKRSLSGRPQKTNLNSAYRAAHGAAPRAGRRSDRYAVQDHAAKRVSLAGFALTIRPLRSALI
jgi:general stress protein YciG